MAHSFKRTELGIYTIVSEQLKHARREKGLTVAECAQKLNIQEKYLLALERSHYHLLPGEMYTRAWIKKYAQFLGLPLHDLMISYEKETSVRTKLVQQRNAVQKKRLQKATSRITGKGIVILCGIIAVLGYAAYIIHESTSPPKVLFISPFTDFQTQENSIILKGQTEEGSFVTINKQPVVLDNTHAFSQEIALYDGINTIRIEAKKKHSRSFTKEVTIVKTSLLRGTTTATTTITGPN